MSNPYQPQNPYQSGKYYQQPPMDVRGIVTPPAIALIVVAGIAIACGAISLLMDLFWLATGAVARMDALRDGPVSQYVVITIRAIWGVALLLASCYVLYGGIRMMQMKDFSVARSACIVAMIPLLGPCCLLGIPFGIWGFIVLSKPEVQQAFGR